MMVVVSDSKSGGAGRLATVWRVGGTRKSRGPSLRMRAVAMDAEAWGAGCLGFLKAVKGLPGWG
jgi:hypothetical protein